MPNYHPKPEGQFKKGQIPWNKLKKGLQIAWNKNKKMPESWESPSKSFIARKKISDALKGRPKSENQKMKISGENHYNWKGGIRKNPVAYQENIAGRKKPKQCELCHQQGRICFDHDHENGKFRGWICNKCNAVLGLVGDNVSLLAKMIEYLNNSKT